MKEKLPKVNIDILCMKDGKILLGLLAEKWSDKKEAWGLPGREINFNEKIGETLKRNLKEEFGESLKIKNYKIISVNANYALGNHYIGIGILAEVEGEPKLLLKQDWKEWRWFSADRLPNMFDPAKHLMECFIKNRICVSE